MSLVGNALLTVALATGAGLSALFGALIAAKPRKSLQHYWAVALFAVSLAWHGVALLAIVDEAALSGPRAWTSLAGPILFRAGVAILLLMTRWRWPPSSPSRPAAPASQPWPRCSRLAVGSSSTAGRACTSPGASGWWGFSP